VDQSILVNRLVHTKRTVVRLGELALVTLFAVAFACAAGPKKSAGLSFQDYLAGDIYRERPAQVNLNSHPKARMFQTRLNEGALKGPNFADRYTVVTWGCGSLCQMLAIVDAQSGRVYTPPSRSPLAPNSS